MFKGAGGGNFQNVLQQAQKMQEKMKQIQEELSHKTVEAASGGGMVRAVVNGQQELVSLTIEKEVVASGDKRMLEDLVVAAVNEGLRQSKEMAQNELAAVAPALNIPGLGKLF